MTTTTKKNALNKALLADMYAEIAIDAYPDGAVFDCVVCDYTFRASAENCEEYFTKGIPRHCGEIMKIQAPEED
jgi:hypothetical protein